MAERNYKVTGSQPVRKPGTKEYAEPGETFKAEPEDVKFLLQVNAISETAAAVTKRGRKSNR